MSIGRILASACSTVRLTKTFPEQPTPAPDSEPLAFRPASEFLAPLQPLRSRDLGWRPYSRQSSPGMIRFMNASNSGTVNAVSP